MNKIYKFLSLAVLLSLVTTTHAYDFVVDGVYYNKTSDTTVEVTYPGSNYKEKKYTGVIVIPDSVTNASVTYGVTSIGSSAFYYSGSLTSLTIPSSISKIGSDAFRYTAEGANMSVYISDIVAWCNILFENMYSNPLRYAAHLYIGEEEITELVIPNDVSTIKSYAFYEIKCPESIVIPSSVTKFGDKTFAGVYVYHQSDMLQVILPDDITRINSSAFGMSVTIYVSPGTNTLLSLWEAHVENTASEREICHKEYKDKPYNCYLRTPGLTWSRTHSTVTVSVENFCEGYSYSDDYEHTYTRDESITITGKYPGQPVMQTSLNVSLGSRTIEIQQPYTAYSYATKKYETFYRDYDIRTRELSLNTNVTNLTASSFSVNGSYGTPDVEVTKEVWVYDGRQYEGKDLFMKGLLPNQTYPLQYIVYCHPVGETRDASYTYETKIVTDALNLTTEQPKVISVGNVIVSAQSNLDDAEENVGFEWRRTDWTNDFASNSGEAYLFDGTMEGYIRNLYAEKLWKYRPYYEAGDGTRYYGEWVGIDPTNTSYFEPTVHTYATVEVKGSTAAVKGYVQRGTDDVAEQGFAYWKTEAGAKGREDARRISSIPDDATTVVARGKVMTATLTGLEAGTEYTYVAYVITDEGETFYGEEQTFRTDVATGIEETTAAPVQRAVPQGVFNLSGQRLSAPQKGLNIINGKKVLVK